MTTTHTYRLNSDYTFAYGWTCRRITAPEGTPCTQASNLPGDDYWLEPPADWPEAARHWADVYGILVTPEQVAADPAPL